MPRKSLADFVSELDRRGNAPAWAHHRGYRTERWSYRRTALVARQFARELEARGVQRGERVLLWGENCAEWVAAFLGCILRGAVAVPMDRTAARDFALRVARDTQARVIVAGRDLVSSLPSSSSSLILDELSQTLAHHGDAPYNSPPLTRSDLAQLVFTSGTTAEPKGVAISHGNLLANLEPLEAAIHPYLKYEWLVHPLRFLDLLPLSHVFGQFMGIWVPPLLGGAVFFHDTLNPAEVTRLVRRERVSVLIAVPRMLESLRARVERTEDAAGRGAQFRRDFDWAAPQGGVHFARRWWRFRRVHNEFGWKFWAFICGGAALDAETEEFWRRLSFVTIQGYGLTETTSLISVNHPFQRSQGSIGKVLPGRELRLSDSGEILVRGENVAAGYWQGGTFQPAAESGWFHTGDVGALDSAGNLFFKGRQKNVIVTPEGMNVYPEDLQAALRAQPEIRDSVVVPLPRDKNAEACAVLLLRGDASTTPEQVAAAAVHRANEHLGAHQRIRHWRLWPEEDFPRTSTQKPRTNLILERVLAQERAASGTTSAPQAGPLAELVARVTGRAPQALAPGATLDRDLGLNSLERVELISAIEDRYQTELSESSVTEAATVADLGRLLDQKPAPGPAYFYPAWTQQTWQQAIRVAVYYLFVWPATHLLAHPRVRGREHLSALPAGPVLVISNHITEIDIGFILAALPARLRHRLAVAMIGERLRDMRNPPAGSGFLRRWLDRLDYFLVVALFNVFPLPQRFGYRESFAYAGASADRGYSVLVFPEGRRTPDGHLSPFRAGIGLLAKRLNLPVVPVRIDGLYELARARRRTASPGTVRVSIGTPLQFAPEDSEEAIVARLQQAVADLEWRAKTQPSPE